MVGPEAVRKGSDMFLCTHGFVVVAEDKPLCGIYQARGFLSMD